MFADLNGDSNARDNNRQVREHDLNVRPWCCAQSPEYQSAGPGYQRDGAACEQERRFAHELIRGRQTGPFVSHDAGNVREVKKEAVDEDDPHESHLGQELRRGKIALRVQAEQSDSGDQEHTEAEPHERAAKFEKARLSRGDPFVLDARHEQEVAQERAARTQGNAEEMRDRIQRMQVHGNSIK